MSARRWYIGQQGRQFGPYGERILKTLANNQKLRPEDLLWTDGMREWTRADAVTALALFARPEGPAESAPPPVAITSETAPVPGAPPADSAAQGPTAPATTPESRPDAGKLQAPPERQPNYFIRHWRGELPLPTAYWVNQVLLSIPLYILVAWIPETDLLHNGTPFSQGLWSLGVVLVLAALSLWQIVGVFRSAQAHPSRGGSRGWAVTAQVISVLGLLRLASTLTQEVPIVEQSAQLLLHGDSMQPAILRVVNHGTEVEVAGGLSFGTAQKLQTLLEATPTVRIVQLNNIGGWISEGTAVGKLIEEHNLSTYTRGECVSACLLAFMGGHERYLATHGRLGFHEASVSGVGGEVAASGTDHFRQEFSSKGVPTAFINHALSTPPSSMWYPTQQELLDAHVITAVVNERDYAMTGVAEWKNEAVLRKEFDEVPVMAALGKLDPPLLAQMRNDFVTGVRQGISQVELSAKMHSVLIEKVVPKYLSIAPDRPLIAYWQVQVEEMRELRAQNPRYCTQFLFPTADSPNLTSMLSNATGEADIQSLGELLITVAETQASVPSSEAVKDSLVRALRSAEQQVPGAIKRIANPERWTGHPRELCDAEIAFFGSALALPSREAGPLLRFLIASAHSTENSQQTSATH